MSAARSQSWPRPTGSRSALPLLLSLFLLAPLLPGLAGCASYRGARLYHEGTQSLERGDASLAISQLEEAASLVPQASEIQNHLGLAYLEGGDEKKAERAFGRAVELDCDNAAARENLMALTAGAPVTVSAHDGARRPPRDEEPLDGR